MARYAPVAPPHVLRKLREYGDFALGTYHLLLAHDVAARPEMYQGLFTDACFIIMDNSVIELGKPVDQATMREACKVVRPRLVVLPDIMYDALGTIEASLDAADKYTLPDNCAFMAVPQGNTLEEISQCASSLSRIPMLGCYGVGRYITGLSGLGSRIPVIRTLGVLRPRLAGYSGFMHLLGFSDNFDDDYRSSQCFGVMGIDSAVPIRMGQAKQLMRLSQPGHNPRGDFWERPCEQIEAETLANIFLMRNWFQGSAVWRPTRSLGASDVGATDLSVSQMWSQPPANYGKLSSAIIDDAYRTNIGMNRTGADEPYRPVVSNNPSMKGMYFGPNPSEPVVIDPHAGPVVIDPHSHLETEVLSIIPPEAEPQ